MDGPLVAEQVHDALLIPMGRPQKAGLYDRDGVLIRAAAYFRGLPTNHFPLESQHSEIPASSAPYAPAGCRYIFSGHLTGHYGHFLFSCLSRLWALPQPITSNVKIVLLNGIHAEDLFAIDFARSIFLALGLGLENFVGFQDPVRFHDILVPAPAIEENHLGCTAFADFCHYVGDQILKGTEIIRSRALVYLTKQKLPSGVHQISNEALFCRDLAKRGVQIISPELLPLRDQIALWRSRPVITGMAGSMLHTSIFTPRRTYLALNPESWLNSNQVILDKINNNSGKALYPRNGYISEPASPGFGIVLSLPDPIGAARDFVREAKRLYA